MVVYFPLWRLNAVACCFRLKDSKEKPMSNRVIIFDTTLRDGEQSPGATMNLQEKLRMARQLESLGVDVIATSSLLKHKPD